MKQASKEAIVKFNTAS